MPDKKNTYRGFTQAQAEAHKRYMKDFVEIKVRMTADKRAAVQEHAASMGESATAFINRAIDERMTADKTPDTRAHMDPSAHPEAAPSPSGSTKQLPPDTWTAAEVGSSYTGETVTEFIDRAISEQTRRDDVSRRLGVNPVTGERLEPKGE